MEGEIHKTNKGDRNNLFTESGGGSENNLRTISPGSYTKGVNGHVAFFAIINDKEKHHLLLLAPYSSPN